VFAQELAVTLTHSRPRRRFRLAVVLHKRRVSIVAPQYLHRRCPTIFVGRVMPPVARAQQRLLSPFALWAAHDKFLVITLSPAAVARPLVLHNCEFSNIILESCSGSNVAKVATLYVEL
jgi:hypothetical protein